MIPYADFLYFGVLLYVIIPTLLLGVVGWSNRRWVLIATLAMVAMQYGGSVRVEAQAAVKEIWIVAGYALFEWGLALGFLQLRQRARRRWLFYAVLILALSPLLLAKYVPAPEPGLRLVGFLGISYVTFRSLDVIISVEDGLITALPPAQFLAYLFFFATISSGPIDRYRRFAVDWNRRRDRGEFLQDLDGAVERIFRGFLYKFILAALVKQYWLDRVAQEAGLLATTSYMYAYSFYLFFDFAGYSAFAIGVSYLFGVHTPENFDRPFLARNIRDFWNRWHISLSWWFRDHVYMRFVMAATKGRWFKSRYTASHLAFLFTFGLMGLWHGTAPYYVLYGFYHAALLVSHDIFTRWNKRAGIWGDGPFWNVAAVTVTFNLVCFGFLLFSGRLGPAPTATHADQTPTVAHAYEGTHEIVSCSTTGGWAWDKNQPDTPINVDIYDGKVLLGTALADQFRQDLVGIGKGNGRHGFVYTLPTLLNDGATHSILVRVSGTTLDLESTAKPVVCRALTNLDGLNGLHDTADCQAITGWAWDSQRPDTPINVDVYDGATLLATVTAAELRQDMLAFSGTGNHGFVLATPARIKDGRSHIIRVSISGTNIDLSNTPNVLTCPAE